MLQVQTLTTLEEFDALQDEWRELSAQCPTSSAFNSWDWQRHWWRVYGQNRVAQQQEKTGKQKRLAIITLRENKRLHMLLPLYIGHTRALKLAPVRELRLLGTGGDTSPDYLGPLYRSHATLSDFEKLCEAIDQLAAWDVARFSDLQAIPEFCAALRSRFGEPKECAQIRYITLPASFDEYLKSLSSNQRKQVRRRRRRFEELGSTQFYRWPSDRPIDDAFDALVTLHNKRWQGIENAGSFNTAEYLDFHKSVMQSLHKRDELRLYCLELNGAMIAMEYSYKWRGGVYSFQCGFDPEFSELRPGQLLLNYSIEHAIEEGLAVYDMLKGDYDYKQSAAKEQRSTLSFEQYRVTGAGRLASFSTELSALKRKLKA